MIKSSSAIDHCQTSINSDLVEVMEFEPHNSMCQKDRGSFESVRATPAAVPLCIQDKIRRAKNKMNLARSLLVQKNLQHGQTKGVSRTLNIKSVNTGRKEKDKRTSQDFTSISTISLQLDGKATLPVRIGKDSARSFLQRQAQ